MSSAERPSLLDFPCDFSIKSMGVASDDFDALVVEIVRRHIEDLAEGAVRTRASSGGKYVSVTVSIRAHNQAQLDAIYRELTAHERILMVL